MKEIKQAEIYQLKITLKYIRPPIWRRVQVPSDIILARLHRIIQVAMGWYDSHLHQFIVGEKYYGVPSIDEFSELELKDERRARLKEVLSKPKKKIVYEYDFGDGWEHEILLEKILQPELGVRYPRCIGGARSCPRTRRRISRCNSGKSEATVLHRPPSAASAINRACGTVQNRCTV